MNSLNGVMVVGLTGQTGAGKSTVSRLFAESGFCVIDADQIARAVVHKGSRCLLELTECFFDILLPNGELNRKALAKQAFQNKKNLELMNSIMYPYIMGEILRQIHHHSRMGQKLILLDAPTLFESRADDFCELIISVTARAELRKARILQRDSITEEAAQARMDAQLPEQFFVEHSDFIIKNNKDCRNLEVVSEEVIKTISAPSMIGSCFFMIQTGYPDTSRRQKRSSWLSLAERVIPHSVGKCPRGTKGQGIF